MWIASTLLDLSSVLPAHTSPAARGLRLGASPLNSSWTRPCTSDWHSPNWFPSWPSATGRQLSVAVTSYVPLLVLDGHHQLGWSTPCWHRQDSNSIVAVAIVVDFAAVVPNVSIELIVFFLMLCKEGTLGLIMTAFVTIEALYIVNWLICWSLCPLLLFQYPWPRTPRFWLLYCCCYWASSILATICGPLVCYWGYYWPTLTYCTPLGFWTIDCWGWPCVCANLCCGAAYMVADTLVREFAGYIVGPLAQQNSVH